MSNEALAGRGLLQSHDEWDERNRVLAESMLRLTHEFAVVRTGRALDVGCQSGILTDAMASGTPFGWTGIDPTLKQNSVTDSGVPLLQGSARQIEFPADTFDVVLLANVFEHIYPEERAASFGEIARVLTPGGVVVGQIPNPYFPIESHSRLPFMGWLPTRAQKVYWRLSPVPWEHDFYVVTMKHLRQTAREAGLETIHTRNFSYPPTVIPQKVRWAARLLERPMKHMPWAWQFVLRRP